MHPWPSVFSYFQNSWLSCWLLWTESDKSPPAPQRLPKSLRETKQITNGATTRQSSLVCVCVCENNTLNQFNYSDTKQPMRRMNITAWWCRTAKRGLLLKISACYFFKRKGKFGKSFFLKAVTDHWLYIKGQVLS